MNENVLLLPGDGIGPEVLESASRVLSMVAPDIRLHSMAIGWAPFLSQGTALPDETLQAAKQADAILMGAVGSPSHRVDGYRSPVVMLRQELGLHTIMRPTIDSAADVDLMIFREGTEGLYCREERVTDRGAVAERHISRDASLRFLQHARQWMLAEGRERVTVVHKANILRETCGLFRELAREVFAGSGIILDELLVDAAAYRLAVAPESFDCIVTTNLFGDILSDLAAAFGGGIGVAASATLGEGTPIFEPVHGSAPDIAGQGIANPVATLRAVVMLLREIGRHVEGDTLEIALNHHQQHGPRTPDAGGHARTQDVTDAVIQQLTTRGASQPNLNPIRTGEMNHD